MTILVRILACLLLLGLPQSSWAQALGGGALLQGGAWAQGHSPMYVGQGSSQAIVQDSGPASGGGPGVGLSEQLLVARGTGSPPYIGQGSGPNGTNWCDYDAPTTNPTGYHFLCLSANVGGGAFVNVGAGGTATPGTLTFDINGIQTSYTGSMPTLYSVGATFTGGLISISGSPITTSGTLGFSVSGNSGGLPYFNSANTWASSPALTAGLPVVGGGLGGAPTSGVVSGNSPILATTAGSLVNGHCVTIDGNSNLIDAGGACTTGGGGGTVSSSTANNMAYYASTGTVVSGLATANSGTLITSPSGVPSISSTLPSAVQGNITSVGTISSGVWAGTPPAAIHGGTGLTSFTSGGLLYSPTTTTVASSAALSSGLPVIGQGTGSAPTTGTKSGNTTLFGTVSGSLTSGDCLKSDASGNIVDNGTVCGGIVFSGTDGGTANAHVITSSGFSLSTNNMVILKATSTNTTSMTANVNGTGVKNVFVPGSSGASAATNGQWVIGNTVALVYDGTQYQLINPPSSTATTTYNTTGSHTFTVPSTAHSIRAILWSGGAGGGGGGLSEPGTSAGGGGGGGGQAIYTNTIVPTGVSSISVFVGSGGIGGAGTTNGSNGTNTTFGSYATAFGGVGGEANSGGPANGGIGGGYGVLISGVSNNLNIGGQVVSIGNYSTPINSNTYGLNSEYGGASGGASIQSQAGSAGGTSLYGGSAGGGGAGKTGVAAFTGGAGGAVGVIQIVHPTGGGGAAGGIGSTVGAGSAGTAGASGALQFSGQGGGGGGSSTFSVGGAGGAGGFPSGGGGGGGAGDSAGGTGGNGADGQIIIIVD